MQLQLRMTTTNNDQRCDHSTILLKQVSLIYILYFTISDSFLVKLRSIQEILICQSAWCPSLKCLTGFGAQFRDLDGSRFAAEKVLDVSAFCTSSSQFQLSSFGTLLDIQTTTEDSVLMKGMRGLWPT